jgi:PAS domain S-box-containing protein
MAQDKELQKKEDRFRTIIDSLQFGIVIIDAQTHSILEANKKALEMIGAINESVSGSVCHRFICPAELGKCPVTDLGQIVDSSERVLLNLQGDQIPILKSVIRTDLDGKDVLIESFIDITDRKRMEDSLQQANKKLNLLFSITRHDILNQLMGLDGYFTILKKKQHDPMLDKYIEMAKTVAKRISSLIRFTKEYERLGINTPVWQDCRVLVDTVAKQSLLRQVTVKNDLSTGTEVFADQLFDRVFYNLIDNTFRHGGDKVKTIRISSQESDANLTILYEDDGVGISANDKKRIFTHGFGRNTGLGLFLSLEILSITGITITENGTPGKGVRFKISVPKGAYRFTSTGENKPEK